MQFPENFYSYRISEHVITTHYESMPSDAGVLVVIEGMIVEASNAYRNRHYQDAIRLYREAEVNIYSHIDPGFPSEIHGTDSIILSRDPSLFDPLLSVALEWMNILPVHQPIITGRPRIPVDPSILDKTEISRTGIISSRLTSKITLDAVADWQLSRTYTDQGNTHAATFFYERAKDTDPETIQILDKFITNTETIDGISSIVSSGLASQDRSFGAIINNQVVTSSWKAGEGPPLDQVRSTFYEERVHQNDLGRLGALPAQSSDFVLSLPHLYYYVIPLGLAECYHALGDYANSEANYLLAASYQYLNETIEAPYIWQRLANLYLEWGNFLFRNDEVADAKEKYEQVLLSDGLVPTSVLYTKESLKPGGDIARIVVANLEKLTGKEITDATLGVNPLIAAAIIEVYQQLLKIIGGLDFWGNWKMSVPIWSFDYLQTVAITFAQLAVSAERDFINFQDRADQTALTLQQINQSVQQANEEVAAARYQGEAAEHEVQAYRTGHALATQRAKDAIANADEYESTSAQAITLQAESAMVSGGDSGGAGYLNSLADTLQFQGSIEGSRASVAAATQLVASRYTRDYEVQVLRNMASELNVATEQAQNELLAAISRSAAAACAETVAILHVHAAKQNLETFKNQVFTPDVWYRLGSSMWHLYRRYLAMAERIAHMMQQAYNFETDQSLHLIKGDYSTGEVKGLLGAEALLADIQTFTYELITSITNKSQPIRHTISLAENYPFAFENQFRKTGKMNFETRIQDFDAYYPGTYAGRIEAVEIEVEGIIPVIGISGSLTNSGISGYRVPSKSSTSSSPEGLKYRVQPKETLIFSDYSVARDALLIKNDERMLRIFQGSGLASTWTLEIPKTINDIDYGALTDIRLTFYYKARFDPDLREHVLKQLSSIPGINERQRGIPLRWVYPDAFFHFQETGELTIDLKTTDFRWNETHPMITNIGIFILTDDSVNVSDLKVGLTTPTHDMITTQMDSKGWSSSDSIGSPWKVLASGNALGSYKISFNAVNNPALVKDGKLILSPIVNIVLILQYSFTPKT